LGGEIAFQQIEFCINRYKRRSKVVGSTLLVGLHGQINLGGGIDIFPVPPFRGFEHGTTQTACKTTGDKQNLAHRSKTSSAFPNNLIICKWFCKQFTKMYE
jgi:hypothetical protein